jgi:C-terminal processing protease CtpA/Prc
MKFNQIFMKYIWSCNLVKALSILFLIIISVNVSFGQKLDRLERERAKDMLNAIKGEIKSKYYDSTYHGIDLDARFKVAESAIDKATSMGQAFGIIAQAVLELNDSHTTFYPPQRTAIFEYGWRWQMVGNSCFITAVKPKSDAEKQGLKVGDEVLEVEGFRPTRKEMWKVSYYYNVLSPRVGLKLKVKSPNDSQPRELDVATKVTELKGTLDLADLYRQYQFSLDRKVENKFVKVGNTTVWKLPTFVIDPSTISNIMTGRIRESSNLILDLRGNGGGYVVALEELAGYFVDKDTKIADLKGRNKMDPQMAKTKGKDVYKGKLIVLVDSRSASASEIFARFMQLEQRGVVIGDQSAGAVMQSRGVPMKLESFSIISYGMSMTNADVIMTDGKSLEHTGVLPQSVQVPTGADIAEQRDPVLAAALQLFGEKVSPSEAGKYYPFKWASED